ncbi:ribonuclease HI family protein [Patescibacteria group bacterium]|nr:ribonuclease HI family protein [Patescibacteria group bacterium]
MSDRIKVYCDGGARGNPGPAGVGVVIIDAKNREKKFKKYLGSKTNNQAEYEAVIFALNLIKSDYKDKKKIRFYLDSELVVKQMRGEYKIKNKKLGRLLIKARNEILKQGLLADFYHIPRLKNHQADLLVNQAIEKKSNA